MGFALPHSHKSSLGDMLDLSLQEHVAAIEEFAVTASKEYSLEKTLDRMVLALMMWSSSSACTVSADAPVRIFVPVVL